MIVRSVCLGLSVALTFPAAPAQTAPRSVVPIREVDIQPVGTPRYAVEVRVNGKPFLTGLDTGSTGLRLLPHAVASAGVTANGPAEVYSYGSGVQLTGRQATAQVAIGASVGSATLQAVESVGCVEQRPDCPSTKMPAAAYGLMGSGQAGQGFQAILGTRLEAGRVPNPMLALGVHRWIVHLPQRGRGDGALVLNPDARDSEGFVTLRAGGTAGRGMVYGCLQLRDGGEPICGPTLLDTGDTSIAVLGQGASRNWRRGADAQFTFAPASGGAPLPLEFVTGDPAHGAHATFKPDSDGPVLLHAGTLPFYGYDVLFDADANTIAIRATQTPDADVRAGTR